MLLSLSHQTLQKLGLFLVLLLTSCSSLPGKDKTTLTLAQNTWVNHPGEAPIFKTKGEKINVEESPLYIEAPGHISMLILPMGNRPEDLHIDLKLASNWQGDPASSEKFGRSFSELLARISEIQQLLSESHPDQALEKLEGVQRKFPDVHWLNFLRASCLVMKGDLIHAKEILADVLFEFPNEKVGLDLYKTLNGAHEFEPRKPASSD